MKQKTNTNKLYGFTIVELLIVIVVIAILAAISVVAYSGITQRANQQLASNEVKTWSKLFMAYQATYGTFPSSSIAAGNYCLGSGFDNGYCRRNSGATTTFSHPENSAETATMMNEIRKIGNPPMNTKKYTLDSTNGPQQGPFITIISSNEVYIHTFTSGSSSADCANYELEFQWIQSGTGDRIMECKKRLSY
jgi:prepilin-type N-terminal cleavage/methylation domain-containing protein